MTSSKTYYYLNSNGNSSVDSKYWWTMSPYAFYGSAVHMFDVRTNVGSEGLLLFTTVNVSEHVVRPVLSLKSCVTLTGTGSPADPYIPHITETCAQTDN